jgi:pimeloyl-ACP methyl ester carboxylesterase
MKIFIHGLESSSRGTKGAFFRGRYPDMATPDFTGPIEERLAHLERILAGQKGIRMVGSSFGGLMGVLFAMRHESRMDRLVLLAPAIHILPEIPHPQRELTIPIHLFHGTEDNVIPLEGVRPVAERLFRNLNFHTVIDDHYLHETFSSIDWDLLLLE